MFTGFCFEIILYKLFCIHTEAQCLIPKSPVQILNTYLLIMKINFLFNKSSVKTFWGNFACYKVLYVASQVFWLNFMRKHQNTCDIKNRKV